jgi:hypothetical protein
MSRKHRDKGRIDNQGCAPPEPTEPRYRLRETSLLVVLKKFAAGSIVTQSELMARGYRPLWLLARNEIEPVTT